MNIPNNLVLRFVVAVSSLLLSDYAISETKISNYLAKTELVARVLIVDSRMESWAIEKEGWPLCGYRHNAKVTDLLMGDTNSRMVEFGTLGTYETGKEYLVFLYEDRDEFGGSTYPFPPDDLERREACLKRLPILKSDWRVASEFDLLRHGWVTAGIDLEVPETVNIFTYKVDVVEVEGVAGGPFEVPNSNLLPAEVTVPKVYLEWESYRSYLLDTIKTYQANKQIQPTQ